MLSRRKALGLVGSTGALGGVSGCLSFSRRDGIGIRIENKDDQQHVVGIEFKEGDETAFTDQYLVAAGGEFTSFDVVTAGEYRVTVDVDGLPHHGYTVSDNETVDFDMEGCDSNSLFVYINENGGYGARALHRC